jgi:DNA-binding GntR family transcriptional regulator
VPAAEERESVASGKRATKDRTAAGARRSLTDTVYQYLKESIVAGHLLPGSQIFEERITQQLDVSRTPVREALQRLDFEGLVEVRAHKGTFVSLIDDESLREIFEYREAIEGQVARLATERMDEDARRELGELLERFRESVGRGDPRAFHDADTRLHRTLVAACGNRRLQRSMAILESQIARTRFLSIIALTRMEKSSSEHEAIVRAVMDRNPREAEETMRHHIRAVYLNLTENLGRIPRM